MRRVLPLAPLFGLGLALSACAEPGGPASSPASPPGADSAPSGQALEWAAWGPAAFERAAAEDKLILIYVVATWCHWCHVMEDTTYADPEVAALLEQRFVIIRVDSDARPDVAERYGPWGWPATALLSPRAEPISNLRGFQKPAPFVELLTELADEHARGELRPRPETLDAGAAPSSAPTDEDLETVRARAVAQLDGYYDPKGLGWGERQKYPWSGALDFALLRALVHAGDAGEAAWRERALATLDAQRPLLDPEWGGVYQYSLRGTWDQPHFEKIAAVQSGALENYAHALMLIPPGDRRARKRFEDDAQLVLDYLGGRMHAPAGGFYTSQDADSPELVGADFYALSARKRRKIAAPRIDTAVYADLNGQLIHGLTELYRADPRRFAPARDLAVEAGERLLATHRRPDGSFSHGPAASSDPAGPIYLADQAALGSAFLALYRVTAEPRWRALAVEIAERLQAQLLDGELGGFFAQTLDPAAVGVFTQRRKPAVQNAHAARFLVELHRLEDHDASMGDAPAPPWLELARGALLAVGSPEQLAPVGKAVGPYLSALELLAATPVDITVVGVPGDPKADALWRAALALYEPRATVERSLPGERYPDMGEPVVFLCTDQSCSAPVREVEAFPERAREFLGRSL